MERLAARARFRWGKGSFGGGGVEGQFGGRRGLPRDRHSHSHCHSHKAVTVAHDFGEAAKKVTRPKLRQLHSIFLQLADDLVLERRESTARNREEAKMALNKINGREELFVGG